MSFNENLHFIMESKGILVKELSAKTGISENTLKTYLRKDCAEPTLSKAVMIANALDVSVDLLARGESYSNETIPHDLRKLITMIQDFSKDDFHILFATAKAIQETRE